MLNKKGQLGIIEAKFFLFGLIGGIVLLVVVMILTKTGVLPNFLGFLCPALPAR